VWDVATVDFTGVNGIRTGRATANGAEASARRAVETAVAGSAGRFGEWEHEHS